MSVARVALLNDNALALEYDASVVNFVRPWLPLSARPLGDAHPLALVKVAHTLARLPFNALGHIGEHTVRLGQVRGDAVLGRTVSIAGPSGVRGGVDGDSLRATIDVPTSRGSPDEEAARSDLASTLTLACALLVNRMGGALMHAAAVVDPSGRAWVIAGDSHSGKTTTCLSLVSAGWGYLSDDHIVIRRNATGIFVEGWPRVAHVDAGWERGEPTHRRADYDFEHEWPGRWHRSASLGGVLLPTVAADRATAVNRVPPGEVLIRVIRQSPWLMMGGEGSGSAVLALLSAVAHTPAYGLSLGSDSYGPGDTLLRLVERAAF